MVLTNNNGKWIYYQKVKTKKNKQIKRQSKCKKTERNSKRCHSVIKKKKI